MVLDHDHSELDDLLAGFFPALAAGEIEQSFATLDLFWARLALHIRAEHLHLFPTLLRAIEAREEPCRSAGAPSLEAAQGTLARLREDHDFFMSRLAAAVKQLRAMREGGHPEEAMLLQRVREQVEELRERLEAHNAFEESQVYPWVNSLLEPGAGVALTEKMQQELDALPPRFRKTGEEPSQSPKPEKSL